MESIVVKLVEHVARQRTSLGALPVAFNQFKVFVNGNLAGYVGKGAGQSVKLIAVNVPMQIKEEISRQVAEQLGSEAFPVVEALRIPDEINDDEDTSGAFDEEF